MTRRRSSAPGRDRSDRHRSLLLVLLIPLAVIAVACGGSGTPSASTGDTSSPGATSEPSTAEASPDAGTSAEPETSTEPEASAEPEVSDEPVESAEATASPQEPTPAPSDQPSAAPGSADACTGNASNRDFYAGLADAVGWTVYCPVLPARWSVTSGKYRLAGGGWMEIGYKGPGGAQITLQEGAFCSDAGGCVPSGTDQGDAPFGDLGGTLVATDDGGWAVVVDRGQQPSWLLVGSGLDESAFRQIAADLVAVGGA